MSDTPTPPSAPVDCFPALDEDLMSALYDVLSDAMEDIHHGSDGWDDGQKAAIARLNSMMWESARAKRVWWATL